MRWLLLVVLALAIAGCVEQQNLIKADVDRGRMPAGSVVETQNRTPAVTITQRNDTADIVQAANSSARNSTLAINTTTSRIIIQEMPPAELDEANISQGLPAENSLSESSLSEHDTAQDCWIVYQGNVYDISAWIGDREGVEEHCGSTTSFEIGYLDEGGDAEGLVEESTLVGRLSE